MIEQLRAIFSNKSMVNPRHRRIQNRLQPFFGYVCRIKLHVTISRINDDLRNIVSSYIVAIYVVIVVLCLYIRSLWRDCSRFRRDYQASMITCVLMTAFARARCERLQTKLTLKGTYSLTH